jgi:hypothetical protein
MLYEGTLGLKPIAAQGDELIVFQSGNSMTLESDVHVPAT